MTDGPSASDTDRLEYEDIQKLCKQNLGTIIRDVDNDAERVRFSPHRYPEHHSTVVEAAVWYTTEPTTPKYMFIVVRGLESGSGGRSIMSEGNEYHDTYAEAVAQIEEIAAEYDGEAINWRDLPKRCFRESGEEIAGTYITEADR